MMRTPRTSAESSRKPRRAKASARVTGVAQLAPVASTNLHEQVYIQLRQAIMTGKFRPGEALTLRGLAAPLGTSIMPARDAVLRLITERALERDGRRVRLPQLDRERLADVWRFRIALEGEAAALAATRASPAEIVTIEHAAARAEKAQGGGRIDRYIEANQEFHFTLYRAAHNDLLQSMIETLWLQIGPHLGLLVSAAENEMEVGRDSHGQIVDAIRRHAAEDARRAIAADLNDSVDIFGPLDAALSEDATTPLRSRAARAA